MKLIIISNIIPYAAVSLAFQQRIISDDVCSSALSQVPHSQQDQLEGCRYFGQDHLNTVSLTYSSSPWTSQDNCHNSTETFCVFSSKTFAGGRGISILTTIDRVENLQQLPAFVDENALSGVNEQPSPPFEEKELPGRGRGLIANKMLHRGDKIFAHTPILMLDSEIFGELETDQWLELEHAGVNNLPPKTKKMFSALYGSPVTDPVSDRIDTNAFVLDLHGVTYYAVFPETAVSARSIITKANEPEDLTTISVSTMIAAPMLPTFLTKRPLHTTYTLSRTLPLVPRLPSHILILICHARTASRGCPLSGDFIVLAAYVAFIQTWLMSLTSASTRSTPYVSVWRTGKLRPHKWRWRLSVSMNKSVCTLPRVWDIGMRL